MAVLGISLVKNGFRYCVLDGNNDSPTIINFNKIEISLSHNPQKLMNWYETTFQNLITNFSPTIIGLKVTLDAKKDEIAPWYYPLGLIHNLSYKNQIKTVEFVPRNFTASKFGMHKSVDIYDYIDKNFGMFKPKWDKHQKYALLSAWMVMYEIK